MITLRRAEERRKKQEAWLTFDTQDRKGAFAGGFGTLETLNEGRFPPLLTIRQPRQDREIITYVREGSLAYENSLGQLGIIRAGEFQRVTSGCGIRYNETNISPTDWAHVFQICLRSEMLGLQPGHEQKRFSTAERRGLCCVVASPDGRRGSLKIHQNSLLISTILEWGQHIVHPLAPGRGAWLHVVEGQITLGNHTLSGGDGAGILTEHAVSVIANGPAELLLLEVEEPIVEVPFR
jgi:hypothetical protein